MLVQNIMFAVVAARCLLPKIHMAQCYLASVTKIGMMDTISPCG